MRIKNKQKNYGRSKKRAKKTPKKTYECCPVFTNPSFSFRLPTCGVGFFGTS
jgi:hypothetical protein